MRPRARHEVCHAPEPASIGSTPSLPRFLTHRKQSLTIFPAIPRTLRAPTTAARSSAPSPLVPDNAPLHNPTTAAEASDSGEPPHPLPLPHHQHPLRAHVACSGGHGDYYAVVSKPCPRSDLGIHFACRRFTIDRRRLPTTSTRKKGRGGPTVTHSTRLRARNDTGERVHAWASSWT
ncbi:hypothetical protein L227DRAFT_24742 [Lentinus tigrinus ALCF2SS1-6]|uniref:Uncharacterized protein n=1 Tax=Lentinus tigrinus ALCF2SS1-6 TaxID=1328759 RepID=A0A5C2SU35_9APHY|nr:hypothetical protein L227DRAFT_24742 [Lentinus tigrinus ALCF2SS1-6]